MEEGAHKYTVALPLLLSWEWSYVGRTGGKPAHLDPASYVTHLFPLSGTGQKSHSDSDF